MTSDGVEVNQARLMAMNIMTVMDQHGYELAGSVDMSASGGEGTSDCEWCISCRSTNHSGHMVLRLQDQLGRLRSAARPDSKTLCLSLRCACRRQNGAVCVKYSLISASCITSDKQSPSCSRSHKSEKHAIVLQV